MNCAHATSTELQPPRPTQSVYREDCTQCFDSVDNPEGLNVCLTCFNGGCAGDRNHAELHHRRSGHPLVLNIKRTRKSSQRLESPAKISKLEITAESEDDKFDTATEVICYACQNATVDKATGNLPAVVDGVMKAMTFARKEEVKAWEQEYTPCEHTLTVQQTEHDPSKSHDLTKCSSCDLKENLWLCLECGNLGCGRSQFGGVGGNSHGLEHATNQKHSVSVKLGSITPEGNADVFCYACNEERIDPDLVSHLAHWNVNIAEREKTEKSLVELQIEQNLKWDFSMSSDGEKAVPVFGPGFTGLRNLGNSCYLASSLQCLFSLPEFQKRYFHPEELPPSVERPAEDLETQMRKLADGLLSGRYSQPVEEEHSDSDVPHQLGIAPAMFKYLVGRNHEEFSTMRQQDASEFLQHIFKLITLSKHPDGFEDPVESFRFAVEQRMQCQSCRRVKYRTDELDNLSIMVPARRTESAQAESDKPQYKTIALKECLDIFTGTEAVQLNCTACGGKSFNKRNLFKTFPQTLAINAQRFALLNWVPTKLDIPIEVGDAPFDMSVYFSKGLQDNEEVLADDEPAPNAFVPDQEAMGPLLEMGFPEVRCQKALANTGNADAEAAMNWLFGHMEDPDIDEPVDLTAPPTSSATSADDAEKISMLSAMGIDAAVARKALRETDANVERAVDWVFSHPDETGEDEAVDEQNDTNAKKERSIPGSAELPAEYQLNSIICHKGASVHSGHYVAFIKKAVPNSSESKWVLYNDDQVVEATDATEMKKFAYVYFFKRV